MKRTTIMVDDDAFAEALRASGERSASSLVRRLVADFLRSTRARKVLALRGSGAWSGDLGAMRDDRPRRRRRAGPPA
ncbi:MAG: type II toxin-antitoxin system VapB family antitoxin [Planctomycetota bacterium]